MYNVTQPDFVEYARSLENVINTVDLLETCGITFLRFYICQHGLCLPKIVGQAVLTNVIELWHDDLEIVQIHIADELSLVENRQHDGAILIGLGGRRSDAHSLASIFEAEFRGANWRNTKLAG